MTILINFCSSENRRKDPLSPEGGGQSLHGSFPKWRKISQCVFFAEWYISSISLTGNELIQIQDVVPRELTFKPTPVQVQDLMVFVTGRYQTPF